MAPGRGHLCQIDTHLVFLIFHKTGPSDIYPRNMFLWRKTKNISTFQLKENALSGIMYLHFFLVKLRKTSTFVKPTLFYISDDPVPDSSVSVKP